MFSGPAGTGKALVARAWRMGSVRTLARTEFLLHGGSMSAYVRRPLRSPDGAPRCDCCAACVQIASGVHPDFTRVMRPKNRTDVLIEQVRELIAALDYALARGATKSRSSTTPKRSISRPRTRC